MLDFTFLIAYLNSMAQPILCICIVTEIRETLVRYGWMPNSTYCYLSFLIVVCKQPQQTKAIALHCIRVLVQLIFLFGLATWTDSTKASYIFYNRLVLRREDNGAGGVRERGGSH